MAGRIWVRAAVLLACLLLAAGCADEPENKQEFIEKIRDASSVLGLGEAIETNEAGEVISLTLNGMHLSDREWGFLEEMTAVEHLGLRQTGFSDDRIRHLENLPRLRTLSLSGDLTDAGMKQLAELEQLEALSLYETEITERSLGHLKGSNVETLILFDDLELTDEGIEHLTNIESLEEVWMGDEEAVQKLEEVAPDLVPP